MMTPFYVSTDINLSNSFDLILLQLKMSAHLTLVLSIVFAVAVNARLAAARSASLLPSEILKHMDGERMFNKVVIYSKIFEHFR